MGKIRSTDRSSLAPQSTKTSGERALRGRLWKEAVTPESSRRRARSTSKRSKRKPPCNGILRVPKVRTKEGCSQREKCFFNAQTSREPEDMARFSLVLTVQKLGCKSDDFAFFSGGSGCKLEIGNGSQRSDLPPWYSPASEPETTPEFERSIFNRDSSVVSSRAKLSLL